MDDLTAFVTARLDEDEAAAKAAILAGDGTWTQGVSMFDSSVVRAEDASVAGDDLFISEWGDTDIQLPHAVHIARHDPARVLREVEAKRKLVTFALENAAQIDGEWGDSHDAGEIASGQCTDHGTEAAIGILGPLAHIWSDHPDYRPEWKP